MCTILDKVIDMGDGDIAVGAVKAKAGLDSPFSIILQGSGSWGAGSQGACRYIDYGNLPIPEVRKYNDEKIKEGEVLRAAGWT